VPSKAAENEWDEWAERIWLALSCFAAGYLAASWRVLVKRGAAEAGVCVGINVRMGRFGVKGEHAAAAGGIGGPAKAPLRRQSLSPVGERQHGSLRSKRPAARAGCLLDARQLSPSACRATRSPGAGRVCEPGGDVRPQQAEASAGSYQCARRQRAESTLAIWTNHRRAQDL
jgi:hypothetical protein